MNRPPAGLCLPCRFRRSRDADTIEISFPGSERIWALRLLDCWAPEKHTPEGKRAKEYTESVMAEAADEDLHVWLPAPADPTRLLIGVLSFDRLLGHLFVDSTTTLSEMIVRAGHATVTKSAGHSHGDGSKDCETGGTHGEP